MSDGERRVATSRPGIPGPLKWHLDGGKAPLASRIVALMPPCTHYVEPFAGGLSVLLARDPEGVSEVVNDLNGDLANFWACLRDGLAFGILRRQLEAMPFSEADWRAAGEPDEAEGYWARSPKAPVDRAVAFFVRCRQSLAGRMDCFAPLSRARTRRGMNEQASAWLTAVEGLPAVHARLKRVVVLNRPAVEVIRSQDGPGSLTYCDPPYLKSTRAAPDVYAHEMSEDDHAELLDALLACDGKVMLSGYRSDLYDSRLASWTRHDFEVANHSAGGSAKRRMVECVWCNF